MMVARMKLRMQMEQAICSHGDITCGCGTSLPIRCMYKCLYCGCWFCRICAHKHFGTDDGPVPVEEWKAQEAAASARRAEVRQS